MKTSTSSFRRAAGFVPAPSRDRAGDAELARRCLLAERVTFSVLAVVLCVFAVVGHGADSAPLAPAPVHAPDDSAAPFGWPI